MERTQQSASALVRDGCKLCPASAVHSMLTSYIDLQEEPNYVKCSDEHNVFYNDLSKEVAEKLTASLRPHSLK